MTIAEFNVIAAFFTFNNRYFNGELPFPKFKIIHSYRTLGQFSCRLGIGNNYYDELLEVSDNYDYTESQFRDIVIHEMIHFYLMHTGQDRRCSHGKAFKRMAEDFNLRYGMNIAKTADISNYKVREGKSAFMKAICTLF